MYIKSITNESCGNFRLKSGWNLDWDQKLWIWICKGYKVNNLKVKDEKIHLTKCERRFELFFQTNKQQILKQQIIKDMTIFATCLNLYTQFNPNHLIVK